MKFGLLCFAIGALLVNNPAPTTRLPCPSESQPLPLELTLRADRNVYKMSDTLRLETQLRNVSEEDVYIWQWDMCWNQARGLSMSIVDTDGKYVQSRFLLDCVPPPPRRGDPYQFFKLVPGSFYGRTQDFKLKDFLSKPGEYDVSATFNSFLSSEWVAQVLESEPISKLSLWTMEHPTVSSNRIRILVKP
jgi:hypothetical protein